MSTIRATTIRRVLLLWMVAVASVCLAQAVSYVEQMSISGGTGRFSDASGTFEVVGEANLAELVYHQSLAGMIANLGRK